MKLYPECEKTMLNSDRSAKQEYSRYVYMDVGLVIEIY